MHKLIDRTPRTSALSPKRCGNAPTAFEHLLLFTLLDLQCEVSWLSGFCHVENNSPEMSYLTGRAHSDKPGRGC